MNHMSDQEKDEGEEDEEEDKESSDSEMDVGSDGSEAANAIPDAGVGMQELVSMA
jgi:hypothetical protein